ncbi:hypothetical protein GF340_04130 [Candidatus Peregrinibacteria bacterium]|nr:hypothetical protein [Candidatus Peregrinibacteria bacterium]
MLIHHCATSPFYKYYIEIFPVGTFTQIKNFYYHDTGEYHSKFYSSFWGGLPIPKKIFQEGQFVWLAYESLHDTKRFYLMPENSQAKGTATYIIKKGDSETEIEVDSHAPIPTANFNKANSYIPILYFWHEPIQILPPDGVKPAGNHPLSARSMPQFFMRPYRWLERTERDDAHPPAYRVEKWDCILRYTILVPPELSITE